MTGWRRMLLGLLLLSGCSTVGAVDGALPDASADTIGDVAVDTPADSDQPALPERSCVSRFSYRIAASDVAVYLVGEWDWGLSEKLVDADGDGVYTLDKVLPPGIYGYRFKVERKDGSFSFVLDPSRSYRRYHDGVENSAIRVADCKLPLLELKRFVRSGVGAATTIEAAVTLYRGEGKALGLDVEAYLVQEGVTQKLEPPRAARSGAELVLSLSALPLGKHTLRIEAVDAAGGQATPLILPFWVEEEAFDWRDSPIYMVLVDRFRDGDAGNNAKPAVGADATADYRGGDLIGIRHAIEEGYFDALGVRTLWLSPLNTNSNAVHGTPPHGSSSYHGYWPIRAREIDPRLGTAQDLEALVKAAHRRGIRILLDWVINHVHRDHEYYKTHPEWFRTGCVCGDVGCDWTLRRLDCLFGKELPDVNWEHPAASEELIDDALWWLERFDLDGLRVDAVKHVEDLAIVNLATRVRERFERAGTRVFLLGETAMGWGGDDVKDSEMDYQTIAHYIGPQALDGQFDFVLYHATAYRVFAYDERSMVHLDYWTKQSIDHYPPTAIMTPYIGSHDTSRFLSQASYRGQDAAHARTIVANKWVDDAGGLPQVPAELEPYQRLQLALGWLLTTPGAPLLYYGDEYGEFGGADPDNRHPWRSASQRSSAEQTLFAAVAALGQARKALPALRRGTYRTVMVSDSVLLFARVLGQQVVLVALNAASTAAKEQVTLPADLPLASDGALRQVLAPTLPPVAVTQRQLTLDVPARSVVILAP